MEKTRVKKGETFWNIGSELSVYPVSDMRGERSTALFLCGNYFPTEEEAEAMARKLRAVLKDADVIEMPSEEDASFESAYLLGLSGHDDGDRRAEAYLDGFADCLHWLKSKIK